MGRRRRLTADDKIECALYIERNREKLFTGVTLDEFAARLEEISGPLEYDQFRSIAKQCEVDLVHRQRAKNVKRDERIKHVARATATVADAVARMMKDLGCEGVDEVEQAVRNLVSVSKGHRPINGNGEKTDEDSTTADPMSR